MDISLLNGDLGNILNLIAAAAGLGTAAMGLVDALKAFAGGPSNFGFGFISAAVARFAPEDAGGPEAFGWADIQRTLHANWINGAAEGDQKAKAKAMIHLRLTKGDAANLAALTGVDPDKLESVAQKAITGGQADPTEIAVLGQFDAVLGAILDEAYERADQRYRNAAKLLALIIATLLAVAVGWLIYYHTSVTCSAGTLPAGCPPAPSTLPWWSYFVSGQFGLAFAVGLSATPLAPVAKDLASALQAAASAVGSARRLAL
jgi:hypothetical protein